MIRTYFRCTKLHYFRNIVPNGLLPAYITRHPMQQCTGHITLCKNDSLSLASLLILGIDSLYLHMSILQVTQLNTLIHLLLGDMTKASRQRIMTICTIDVHARDVVQKMIVQKVENDQAFTWLSQLRHR